MSFEKRSYWHDQVAIPHVIKKLEESGFKVVRQGHEQDNPEIRDLLAGNQNITSLMIRHKPDLLACNLITGEILLVEVKSDQGGHPNFAIEFNSYISMIEHGRTSNIIYAFVDLSFNGTEVSSSVYCKLNYVQFPKEVRIPKRGDHLETEQYIKDKYPTVTTKLAEYKGNGSGTAFFLHPKSWWCFKDWSELSPVEAKSPDFRIEVEQLALF